MKNKYKLFGPYLPIFLAVLISTVVMRTLALFNDFSVTTTYFTNKTLITIADYFVVGASLIMLTYLFIARKDMKLIPDFTSPATYVPTGVVGCTLLFLSVHFFIESGRSMDLIQRLSLIATPSARSSIANERILMILAALVAVLAILSAVHFVLCALIEKGASSGRANFGICTVAFLALYAIYLYFDGDLPINSPGKILDQMSYLLAAVFFLYETRLSLGRERWRPYIAFGLITALVTAYSSIPSLIFYFAKGVEVSSSIYEMVLSVSLFIFITARILLTGNLIEDVESPIARVFREASDARALAITPQKEKCEVIDVAGEPIEEDGNQLPIDDVCESEEGGDTSETAEDAAPTAEDNEEKEEKEAEEAGTASEDI